MTMKENNGNQNRLVDEWQIVKIIFNLLVEKPGLYIHKQFLCKEYGWGCREWKIASKFLHLISTKFDKFYKDVLLIGRLQGSPEEIYNKIVELFIEKFKIPPVIYTGSNIEEGGVYIPPSYVVMTYYEFRNRKNRLALKGLRDDDTKLHNVVDKGMQLTFLEEEKELINDVVRMLAGGASAEGDASSGLTVSEK